MKIIAIMLMLNIIANTAIDYATKTPRPDERTAAPFRNGLKPSAIAMKTDDSTERRQGVNYMFEYLKKAVEKHYTEEQEKAFFYIANGYYKSWAEEHRKDKDAGLYHYSTAKTWNDYKNGKITRAQAIEKAQKRAAKEVENYKSDALAKIERAETAQDVTSVYISVEWKRNRTWGKNPSANVLIIGEGEQTGSASGCGYDKLSTAISAALNKSPAMMKALYIAEENRLKGIKTRKQARGDVIGYGSGYDVLPYFEGGCGVSVYPRIFAACGLSFEYGASGKMFDSYSARRIH